MSTPSTYDVIIVGGRLAGASTAMLLARAGLRVLVLEQGRYGSDTLSTHAFMRAGVVQLSRWGLLDQIIAAGTPAVQRTVVRYGSVAEPIDISPIPDCPALFAPRRHLLDRVLADAAIEAGADVRFEHRVLRLRTDLIGRVSGVVYRDSQGRQHEASATLTIGADGPRSTIARQVGAPTYRRGRHATAFVVGYWSGVAATGYHWLYAAGASAGIIPTNDGQVCAWVGMPSTRFPVARQLPDRGFRSTLTHVAADWMGRLDSGHQHGPLRGFAGIEGYLRQPWGNGWALVGDAGYFKDPITAHGMTDALRDAELLARAVDRGLRSGNADLSAELAAYQRTRDELSHELFGIADRVASFDWDMDQLRPLLLAMSQAMRAEVRHLSDLAPAEVAA